MGYSGSFILTIGRALGYSGSFILAVGRTLGYSGSFILTIGRALGYGYRSVYGPQAVNVGSGCACYSTFSFEDVGSTCSFASSFECTDSACCFDSSPLSSFLDNAREILPKN